MNTPQPWQVIFVLLIVVLFFGARNIPDLLRGIRKGMDDFNRWR